MSSISTGDLNAVMNTLLTKGIKHKELSTVMASNGLVEWFGRSIKTNAKIADFFL